MIGVLEPSTGPPSLAACLQLPFVPQISTPEVWGIFYVGLLLRRGHPGPLLTSPSNQAMGPGVLAPSEFTAPAVKSVESVRIARAALQTSGLV
jgi:hypothetical protein